MAADMTRAGLAKEAKTWIAQVAIAAHRHSPAQIKVAVEAMEAFIDQLAAHQAEVWRPMAEAPKDGELILLGFDGLSFEGHWMGDASRNHWGNVGWFLSDDDILTAQPKRPHCWRPLPKPPAIPTDSPGAVGGGVGEVL